MQRAGDGEKSEKGNGGREGDTYTRQGKVWEGVKKEIYVRRGGYTGEKTKKEDRDSARKSGEREKGKERIGEGKR